MQLLLITFDVGVKLWYWHDTIYVSHKHSTCQTCQTVANQIYLCLRCI